MLVIGMRRDKTAILITAIVCISLLEAMALWKGIDGQLFASVIAGITALVGYMFGKTSEVKER